VRVNWAKPERLRQKRGSLDRADRADLRSRSAADVIEPVAPDMLHVVIVAVDICQHAAPLEYREQLLDQFRCIAVRGTARAQRVMARHKLRSALSAG
jgi:hypothetical protein